MLFTVDWTVVFQKKNWLLLFQEHIKQMQAVWHPRTDHLLLVDKLGIADVSEEHADGEPKALDLNDMKVAELRELARARRMKGYSRLKKSELIDRLKGVWLSSPGQDQEYRSCSLADNQATTSNFADSDWIVIAVFTAISDFLRVLLEFLFTLKPSFTCWKL